jgi:hypothetical protein
VERTPQIVQAKRLELPGFLAEERIESKFGIKVPCLGIKAVAKWTYESSTDKSAEEAVYPSMTYLPLYWKDVQRPVLSYLGQIRDRSCLPCCALS